MAGILGNASFLAAAALGGVAVLPGLTPVSRDRARRLQTLVTLLHAPDPTTRVDALERAQALAPGERARVARLLRRELSSGPQGTSAPVMTTWFIRQVLALLGDARLQVRADAARVLRELIGRSPASESGGAATLAPAVAAALELAGGKVLTESGGGRDETRVLAFAEMLEAGLQPLVISIQSLDRRAGDEVETLLAALHDRSPRVRRSVCEVLAAMGGPQAIELLTSLLEDPSPELRTRAAQALGELHAEGAVARITPLLRDRVPEVRMAAATALAAIGAKAVCAAVLAALREECSRPDGSDSAQAALVEAAAALASATLPELGESLEELPRPVAARLAAGLERTGLVAAALGDAHWADDPQALAGLLAKSAGLGATAPLIAALDATDEQIRQRAVAALGSSREPASLLAVVSVLEDPDAGVRSEAVASVAKMSDPRALGPLARAATDPDPSVRRAAVTGLCQVLLHRTSWRREMLPPDLDLRASLLDSHRALLFAAKDSLEAVRAQAAGGLGLFASSEAAETLVEMALGDGQEVVRTAAAEGLVRCGFAQTRRLLVSALGEQEETRRARAVAVLGTMGEAESGPYLVEALRDPAAGVREAALLALARIEVQSLAGRLAGELRNDDARVRAGAAALLGKAGAAAQVEGLVGALADPEEDVRVNALSALAGLGRAVRRHQHELTARLSDPSPRVREVAAAALAALREAWAEMPDISGLLRQGRLTPGVIETVLDAAAEGDIGPLLRALESSDPARSLAAFFAGPGWRRLGPLLAAINQSDERNRARLFVGLAQALEQEGSGCFLSRLRSVDPEERLTAVEVAALLATPEAIAALAAALAREPVLHVRTQIVSVLAELPDDAAQAALLEAQTRDPSMAVRLAATRALSQGQVPAPAPEEAEEAADLPGERAEAAQLFEPVEQPDASLE